jgi:copper chaperone CopZ
MPEFKLKIDGMHCGACVRRASQALAAVEGLNVVEVRVGEARLSAAPAPTGSAKAAAPVDLAIAALARAGYGARLE